jgi:putative transposase
MRLWENAWTEFIPFLDYDVEIRKVICSTNAIVISSLN